MVLGFGGFLGLSTAKYKAKLRDAALIDLRKQELVKIRRQFACAWAVASGIGWAFFTHGGSLIICGVAGRRCRVADRKLTMIREEIASRGEALHKLDWKDVVIPVASSAVGTAIGAGVDIGIGSLIQISDIVPSGSGHSLTADSSSHLQQIQAVLSHPAHAARGFEEGVVTQPDIVAHGGYVNPTDMLGTTPSDAPVQAVHFDMSDASNNHADLAEVVGAQLGAQSDSSLEQSALQNAGQELSWWLMESFESPQSLQKAVKGLGCVRYLGTSHLMCDGCGSEISLGSYWRKLITLYQGH